MLFTPRAAAFWVRLDASAQSSVCQAKVLGHKDACRYKHVMSKTVSVKPLLSWYFGAGETENITLTRLILAEAVNASVFWVYSVHSRLLVFLLSLVSVASPS